MPACWIFIAAFTSRSTPARRHAAHAGIIAARMLIRVRLRGTGAAQMLPMVCEHRSSSCAVGLLARARERGGRALALGVAALTDYTRFLRIRLTNLCLLLSCGVKCQDSGNYLDYFKPTPCNS